MVSAPTEPRQKRAARLPTAIFNTSVTNVADLVLHCAKEQPQVPALIDKKTGDTMTFAELARGIDATAAGLIHAGLEPGDRCVVFVATGPAFVECVFGCFAAGVLPVLIDPGMGVDNMLTCIAEQRPRGLLGVAKAHVLKALKRDAFKSVEVSVLVGGGPLGMLLPGAKSLTKLKAQAPRLEEQHRTRVGNVAAVLYTSGSTGAPKGVLYTHAMLAAQTRAIRDMFAIKPGEVDVCAFLPFALFSVAMGMTAVFPDMDFRFPAKADPKKILDAMHGADAAFASPALWTPFAAYLNQTNTNLPGVKRILTAGAPVSPRLHDMLVKHLPDGDVFTPYGATEALPVAFMSGRGVVNETAALTRDGWGTCVGDLAPGIEVMIIPLNDGAIGTIDEVKELAVGEIGEIVVRGACVTMSYDLLSERGRKANELSKIGDGVTIWHRMGDAGHFDDKGRLWFCGRKGHRVERRIGTGPDATTEVLHSIPVEAVVETIWPERAALVGATVGDETQAVVWLERTQPPGALPPIDDMLAKVRALPGCAHIDAVLFFDEPFPVDRRHNAKIERERLRELAIPRLTWKHGAPTGQ